MAALLRLARAEVLAPCLMVRFPWDLPFNVGDYAATKYYPGALIRIGEAKRQVLVMFPSREGLLFHCFPFCGCFERKHNLTQGLKVVHQVD